MDGQEIIDKFEGMVDDQLSSDLALQLANDAINEIEAMKDWLKLTKETSYTLTAGQSYTDTQALPTRFANDIRVVEADDLDYAKIDFTDRYQKVNSSNAYFLDMANDTIGFAGLSHPSVTVYLYYTEYSADITTATEWVFPERFHKIIPYQMAKIYYAVDAGEKGRAWDDRWTIYYDQCLASMMMWDDRLRTRNRRVRNAQNREDGLNLPR